MLTALAPAFGRRRAWLAAVLCAAVAGCGATTTARRHLAPLVAVPTLDLARYTGTWYEIARFPERYEAGCFGSVATYTACADGSIAVRNSCHQGSLAGPTRVAEGRARLPDPTRPAQLEVSFFRPFWADYWVIELDPDYTLAVVGHPSRDHLWILSRTPQVDAGRYAGVLQRLRDVGYEVERLERTPQPAA